MRLIDLLRLFPLQEFLIDLLGVVGAEAVAEFRFRVVPDIGLHLGPGSGIVSDFFTIRADGEGPPQDLHFFQGLLPFLNRLFPLFHGHLSLQAQNRRHPDGKDGDGAVEDNLPEFSGRRLIEKQAMVNSVAKTATARVKLLRGAQRVMSTGTT